MTLKVLFVCKSRGVYSNGRFGLWNSATFVVTALKDIGVKASLVEAIDANCLDRLVTEHKPHVVILEAIWTTPEKLKELTKLHPAVRFVVRVHSKMTFLATEGTAIDWLASFAKIPGVFIAGNNFEFVRDMGRVGIPCVYMPNMYTPPYRFQHSPRNDGFFHIGCFGAPRPMKNQLAQAVAAIIFGDEMNLKIAFHINSNAVDPGAICVVKNLRALFEQHPTHELIEHDWVEHETFCRLVATMHVGMQVSLSETFNIVSADFVWQDVPVVVSKEISFINWGCRCDNDTNQMIGALKTAYYGKMAGLQKLDLRALTAFNKESLQAWQIALGL